MKFNLFLGIILFLLSVIISIKFSNNYTKKKLFYKELLDFIKRLKLEISFNKQTINSIIQEYKNSTIYVILNAIFIEKNEIHKDKYNFLSDLEFKEIIDFLKDIGKQDTITQLKYVDKQEIIFNEKLHKSEQAEEKYKPLIIKLGVYIGLIVFVLVI